MTTIVWHRGYLFADSTYTQGGEKFESLDKVVKLDTPLLMRSATTPNMNDTIYAWACTGARVDGVNLIKHLQSVDGDYDATHAFYCDAAKYGLIAKDRHCCVMLVGRNGVYAVDFDDKDMFGGFLPHTYEKSLVIGAGSAIVRPRLNKGWDPVRAMFYAADIFDESCGGKIDAWHLPNGAGMEIVREGIYLPRTGTLEMSKILRKAGAVLPYDIVPVGSTAKHPTYLKVKEKKV